MSKNASMNSIRSAAAPKPNTPKSSGVSDGWKIRMTDAIRGRLMTWGIAAVGVSLIVIVAYAATR